MASARTLHKAAGGLSYSFFSAADQAASSLSNVLVVVLVARVASPEIFGSFSAFYITYTVVIGLNQAFFGQVLVLVEKAEVDRSARRALRTIAAMGLALVVIGIPGALVLGSRESALLAAAFAVSAPVLLLQDFLRFWTVAKLSPAQAFGSDAVWLVTFISIALVSKSTAFSVLLAWICGATAGLVVLLFLLRRNLRGPLTFSSLRRRTYLGYRFATEYAAVQASPQLAILGIGLIASLADTGALRSIATLMGPLAVVYTAVSSFGAPYLKHLHSDGLRVRAVLALCLGLSVLAIAWTLLLRFAPISVGLALLGQTWLSAQTIVVATGTQYTLLAVVSSTRLLLRTIDPRRTLPIQLMTAPVLVVGVVAGYLFAGIQGAAWSMAIATALQAVLSIAFCWSALKGNKDACVE